MIKFNLDFRIKTVTEYLSDYGSTTLAKRYGVAGYGATILNKVHNFEILGIMGLGPRKMDLNYSSQFKVKLEEPI